MDHITSDTANETPSETELEFVELGEVSAETRGTVVGSKWDGGWGTRPP